LEREQRRGARASFEGWVELLVAGEHRLARSSDLSEGGLGLVLPPPHPAPGTHVESEFALPGFAVPLSVRASVVWSDPRANRLGLAFEAVDVAVAELLQSAVAGRFRAR
jgi:hypothetical protein